MSVSAQPEFRRSSLCADKSCVEVATPGGAALMRDGKDPAGPVLQFGAGEWNAFLDGVRGGEFDA